MVIPGKPDQIIELNMRKMHISALWLTLAAAAAGAIFMFFFHDDSGFSFTAWSFFLWLLLYIGLIILHELFHLIGFMVWGKCKKKDLVFGINRELGAAYAGTKKLLPNKAMKKALLLPFWLTGFLPFLLGIWLNNGAIMLSAAFLIGGAAGDFSMYVQLRKVRKHAFILDNLNEPKLYVYNKKPQQDEKCFSSR